MFYSVALPLVHSVLSQNYLRAYALMPVEQRKAWLEFEGQSQSYWVRMRQQKLGRCPSSQREGLAVSHWLEVPPHHMMSLNLYKLTLTVINWFDSLLRLTVLCRGAAERAESAYIFPWGIWLRMPDNWCPTWGSAGPRAKQTVKVSGPST